MSFVWASALSSSICHRAVLQEVVRRRSTSGHSAFDGIALRGSDSRAAKALKMHTGYASIVDASTRALRARLFNRKTMRGVTQHPQARTAAATAPPPQPARRAGCLLVVDRHRQRAGLSNSRRWARRKPPGAQPHGGSVYAALGVACMVLLLATRPLDRAACFRGGADALDFGLRHGVDCDHIAAIDNVARALRGAAARLCRPSRSAPTFDRSSPALRAAVGFYGGPPSGRRGPSTARARDATRSMARAMPEARPSAAPGACSRNEWSTRHTG